MKKNVVGELIEKPNPQCPNCSKTLSRGKVGVYSGPVVDVWECRNCYAVYKRNEEKK